MQLGLDNLSSIVLFFYYMLLMFQFHWNCNVKGKIVFEKFDLTENQVTINFNKVEKNWHSKNFMNEIFWTVKIVQNVLCYQLRLISKHLFGTLFSKFVLHLLIKPAFTRFISYIFVGILGFPTDIYIPSNFIGYYYVDLYYNRDWWTRILEQRSVYGSPNSSGTLG